MTSPNIKVNTFLKEKDRTPFIDVVSKLFIGVESILGLCRLPVLFDNMRHIVIPISIIYSLLFKGVLMYLTYKLKGANIAFSLWLCFIEYTFCSLFSFITWRRTERYYCELMRFDNEIGCRPHLVAASIRNLCWMFMFTTCIGVFSFFANYFEVFPNLCVTVVPMNLIHCMEMYYYGQLLSLLIPRLRLINYYVESALSCGEGIPKPKIEEFPSFKYKHSKNNEMSKLMDMYYIAIKAYDLLVDAVKWQLLVFLITTFGVTLDFCYQVSLSIIRNENPLLDIMTDLGIIAAEMIPLFSPCVFGDRVHNEVRRLRELIASRLYENKLGPLLKILEEIRIIKRLFKDEMNSVEKRYRWKWDKLFPLEKIPSTAQYKLGRSAARALLALTEARDLSFSLLRMLQIDISLPFKFIGLLVTYLIILLQFDKVIHSSQP